MFEDTTGVNSDIKNLTFAMIHICILVTFKFTLKKIVFLSLLLNGWSW